MLECDVAAVANPAERAAHHARRIARESRRLVHHYAVADRRAENMFLAITTRLGAGRSDAEKHRFIDAVLDAVDQHLGSAQATMSISVEFQEINPEFRINKNNIRSNSGSGTS